MSPKIQTRRVQLPPDTPFAAVGAVRPGQIVEVDAEEAARLISVKGFVPADGPVPTSPSVTSEE